MDADTGQTVAAALTLNDVNDDAEVGPSLKQIYGPLGSAIADAHTTARPCAAPWLSASPTRP